MFYEKIFLKSFVNFTGKHLCWSLFEIKLQAYNFIKKETPTQVFSYEIWEIFENTHFQEYL